MRIAIVAPLVTRIEEPQQGGSQAVVADLAAALQARGHLVHVYAATGSAIPGVDVIDVGVRAEALADLKYRADGHWEAEGPAAEEAFARVFTAAGRGAYDVLHNHAFDPPAVRSAARMICPVVHTLHLPPDPMMVLALNEASQREHPPTIVSVSSSSAAAWGQVTRVDGVIRNGVPLDRIPWSAEVGSRLLFAGRFSFEKGVVDAIAIAGRAGIPVDVYGEPYDQAYFHSKVEPFTGERGIKLHGAVPRSELWQAMARSLAVLCPAKWDEPFGMAAAEAQAAGTPVIAYDVGALSEVIVDRRTGFLVPEGDIAGAVRAVKAAALIDRVDCRRHAESKLSLEASVTAHEQLYHQLAGRPLREGSRA